VADNPFDLSEQTLKQAYGAYHQLCDFMTTSMGVWAGAMPANPMTDGFKEMQSRAMEMAMENAEAAFTVAGKICNAPTPQNIVTLQTQFAQERSQAFVDQAQQLFSFVGAVPHMTEGGAGGVRTGAIPINPAPSNPAATFFRDVQDRAVGMAKKNAESAFALVEKMAKSQDLKELFTFHAHFAQEHMEAYAAQIKELQELIEEAVEKQATDPTPAVSPDSHAAGANGTFRG
jgi:hypothetical protein